MDGLKSYRKAIPCQSRSISLVAGRPGQCDTPQRASEVELGGLIQNYWVAFTRM